MKIVVTGGAGFIGSTLVRSLLDNGHQVTVVDDNSYGDITNLPSEVKSNLVLRWIDIREKAELASLFKQIQPDAVAHLAAIAPLPDCQSDPSNAYSVNVGGTLQVLEACRYTNVQKVVFASTGALYENNPIKHREEDCVNPDLIYPMTKYHAEQICKSYVKNYGLDITMLRLFNVYGVLQSKTRKHPAFMGYLTNCIKNNLPIKFYNNKNTARDYINVKDVVRAFKILIEEQPKNANCKHINIGSGKAHTVTDLLEQFKVNLSDKINYDFDFGFAEPIQFWDKYPELQNGTFNLDKSRLEHEVVHPTLADNLLASELLNWQPTISIEEGIKEICDTLIL
ncbi:NAD-dependent epimerase/dehydratase family protein [bacterium]|nr:NAD-dependent epimerase/dehydratase family protein [bacterium]